MINVDTAESAIKIVQRIRESPYSGDFGVSALLYGLIYGFGVVSQIPAISISVGVFFIFVSFDFLPNPDVEPKS